VPNPKTTTNRVISYCRDSFSSLGTEKTGELHLNPGAPLELFGLVSPGDKIFNKAAFTAAPASRAISQRAARVQRGLLAAISPTPGPCATRA
jgi:hypothetical protein